MSKMTQREMTAADYLATIPERAFQGQVEAEARNHGWMVYHTYDSRRSEPGFPDLVMVHTEHGVVYAELKRMKGTVSAPQQRWIDTLTEAGATVYLWRPSDWDEIYAVLKGETA